MTENFKQTRGWFVATGIWKDTVRLGLLIIWLLLVNCSGNSEQKVALEAIPGTEWAAPFENCLSLSPDGKWLIFLRFPVSADRRNTLDPIAMLRLSSLNLETGERRDHNTDGVPKSSIWTPEVRSAWQDLVWWVVEKHFKPDGWNGGLFYLRKAGYRDLVVDPNESVIRVAGTKNTIGTCGNCPPINRESRAAYDHLHLNADDDDPSWVYEGNTAVAVYYKRGAEGGRTVYRSSLVDSTRILFEVPDQVGSTVRVEQLRVSPGERYLAYDVHVKKGIMVAGPWETMYILNLETGEKRKVIECSYIGNFQWSPDGRRLYFAAGNMGEEKLYVLDAQRTLKLE